MAGIFGNYRCEHHPDRDIRIPLAIRTLNGEIQLEEARRILRRRDRWMCLEAESSSLAGILIEAMVKACPKKKFIHTVRDVFTWADSWFDHNVNSPPRPSAPFSRLDRVRLRVNDFPPTKYDAPLVRHGLPSLASHFQLWQSHNEKVLETVPSDRLLIVRTQQIIYMIPEMAGWLGVPHDSLKADRGWLFAAPEKHGLLGTLDASYVRETAERFCGTLMEQLFPGTLGTWPDIYAPRASSN